MRMRWIVPFRQADDIDKVVDLLTAIESGSNTKESFAEFFEFDERQGDYYANAASYLGLVDRQSQEFVISDLGITFLHVTTGQQRTKIINKKLLKKPTFRRIIRLFLLRDLDANAISNDELSRIIKGGSTATRCYSR